jgi:hypothetical protein
MKCVVASSATAMGIRTAFTMLDPSRRPPAVKNIDVNVQSTDVKSAAVCPR